MLEAVLVLVTSMTLGARAVPGAAGERTWEEHVRAMDAAIAAAINVFMFSTLGSPGGAGHRMHVTASRPAHAGGGTKAC